MAGILGADHFNVRCNNKCLNKTHPGDIFSTGGLIVVHVDPLELEVGGAAVGASGVDAVLVRDDLPELGSDLVSALTSLEVDNFSHLGYKGVYGGEC